MAARRLKGPRGWEIARATAEAEDVCIRPLLKRRTNLDTGTSEVVPIACGSRLRSVCPPCARRYARIVREQCREGWHLTEEPTSPEPDADTVSMMKFRADLMEQGRAAKRDGDDEGLEDVREALADVDRQLRADHGVRGKLPGLEEPDAPGRSRRVRSTRRRRDSPDLPRKPVDKATIGREYAGRYRPSMFTTLTLPSYGAVHSVSRGGRRCSCGKSHRRDSPVVGAPVDPDSYDYRSEARDLIHFAAMADRFWQNLRRAVGWNVQYFAVVESQRRLAPHLHAAIRGSIPRALIKQVAAGTYHQVWWPHHDDPVYGGTRVPVWVPEESAWCDPDTRQPLPTFEESLPGEEDDPAHVVRFGDQVDIRGVLGGGEEANRHVKYLTKYVTKTIGETYADASEAHRQHADRLLAELAITPCSSRCPVWLLHGIQPRGAHSRLNPGLCKANAHKRTTLGVAGRRVLVSRKWTGKTRAEHAQDRRDHVHAMLSAAGLPVADTTSSGRYVWEPVSPTDPGVPSRSYLLLQAVAERRRWKAEFEHARLIVAAGTGPPRAGGRAGEDGGPRTGPAPHCELTGGTGPAGGV
ncbi:replication initiator [Saccharopolyspora sp. NPDC002376]